MRLTFGRAIVLAHASKAGLGGEFFRSARTTERLSGPFKMRKIRADQAGAAPPRPLDAHQEETLSIPQTP